MSQSIPSRPSSLIPSPRGLPLLGNLWDLRAQPFETMLEWHRRYGDILRFAVGPRDFYMVSHPALAAEILVSRKDSFEKIHDPAKPLGIARVLGQGLATSRGALWRRQRDLLQPLFQNSRVAGFLPTVGLVCDELTARWRRREPDRPVDVAGEMMRSTLEVIARGMFGTSMAERADELAPALMTVLSFAAEEMRNPFMPPLWLPTPANRAFRSAMRSLDELVYGLIRQRRADRHHRDDLLGTLLAARDLKLGEGLDERQIRDEVLTIFIAGHETTAVALTWTFCFLSRHPEARERLEAEADGVLGGRTAEQEDVPRLVFARAVFDEALRLYPPAMGLLRKTLGPVEMGGFWLPEGATVLVNIANIQRHPEIWDAPDEFRPERFLQSDSAEGRHRLGFMPFGAGPRACLGARFATNEAVLLLATLAGRFRLDLPPDQAVKPGLALTLRPKTNPRMALSMR